jgi:RNA-binding protein
MKLEPSLIIGKAGITDNVIKQAKDQLKKKKTIKVKFLSTAIKNNKKELVNQLAQKANAKVKQRIGFTAVLERIK